jgi:hypothetical protein
MVIYTCPNCLKEFKQKGHFIDHTERKKKPCIQTPPILHQKPPIYTNDSTKFHQPNLVFDSSDDSSLDEQTLDVQNQFEENKVEQNKFEHIQVQNMILKENFTCAYCDSEFTRKDALKRHMNNRCASKKDYDNKKREEHILLQHVQELKQKLDDQSKQIEELKKQKSNIKNIKNVNNVVINSNSNNSSNNSNINNIGNSVSKNINIVPHGEEDLSTIDLETKLDFLNTLDFSNIIPNMAKHLFINDDKPEFKNFRVTDISRNKSEYHDGKKWNTGRADQGVSKIFENINDMLGEPFTQDNLEKTIQFIKKNPKKYSKQTITWSKNYCKNLYDNKEKENIVNRNNVINDLKLIFYNNREQILNTDKTKLINDIPIIKTLENKN